jgi:rubrerythrin
MALSLTENRGVALDRQHFTWREMVQTPISKLDDDAFTRVRVILMNGQELEALRFGHAAARHDRNLRVPLAEVRRVEQHQATLVNWLLGADHSPLETTIAYEQVAIEVTAAMARREPDEYLAANYRFGLLEDFDHLYRYSALLDRLTGMDANNILQCYTDILPGRPTAVEHRAPVDNVRRPFDRRSAHVLSKLHALTLTAAEHQTHDYYMNIGPTFADPLARQLYAEIASIEEQHVTQYESLLDPEASWLEDWLLHEANEAYNYYGCMQQESNPRIRAIWERMLDYELGQFHYVRKLFEKHDGRHVAELFPEDLPDPFPFESNREFVRATLAAEVDLRAAGTEIVDLEEDPAGSIEHRNRLNADGSPSERVAENYRYTPGTELNRFGRAA